MRTTDFDYDLPVEYIAQIPLEKRDQSKLLILDRKSGEIEHRVFKDVVKYLNPGDILVVNETRVIPARLFASKLPSGGRVEILLLKKRDEQTWEAMVGGKGLVAGKKVRLVGHKAGNKTPIGEIVEVLDGAERVIWFDQPLGEIIDEIGNVPLPPYIHTRLNDPERYQTVYAKTSGSAAAPTAGLHFTQELIEELRGKGIGFASVTLHVGLDTFAPVKEEDPQEHKIHTEWCSVSQVSADKINTAKSNGFRVIAVGTTSVRTLESATMNGKVYPFAGPTSLFILPGYRFKMVDRMVTNFHLPRSTLIMLVSAFAGREKIMHTYEVAKQENYRFYSFGDAMLII